ncbi:MAG TPA: hypothetical protein VNZ85_18515 [Caulobacter sp.]|nr:hypothetical protein [Caulobacter sp.]
MRFFGKGNGDRENEETPGRQDQGKVWAGEAERVMLTTHGGTETPLKVATPGGALVQVPVTEAALQVETRLFTTNGVILMEVGERGVTAQGKFLGESVPHTGEPENTTLVTAEPDTVSVAVQVTDGEDSVKGPVSWKVPPGVKAEAGAAATAETRRASARLGMVFTIRSSGGRHPSRESRASNQP